MPLTPDPAALAARCLELSPDGPLALGLSGGGDSVALSLILARAARQGGRDFHGLIVDHGLRPESGAEAQTAAARARALGAEVRILTWAAPRKGQAAARAARHRLLAGACARIGATTLFLAHTLDDRLETLRMRLVRPGSWRGAAGMAVRDPSPAWPEGADLVLARPLLDQRRAALRDFLKAEGADWIEDPSNADPAYERVRVRAAALDPGEEAALLGLSDAAQALETQTRRAAAALAHRAARLEPWGGLALDPGPFEAAPALIALRGMEALAAAASGEPAPPRPAAARILLAALKARAAASAAGAMIAPHGDRMVLGRDPGAALGRADGAPGAAPLGLGAGEAGVFDGRFAVSSDLPVTLRPAPLETTRGLEAVPDGLRAGLAAVERSDGAALALIGLDGPPRGVRARLLAPARLRSLLFPFGAGTWFDEG